MPHTLTFTGHTGPGSAVTALTLTGVTSINIDFAREVLQVHDANDNPVQEFDLHGTATITAVLTGTNWAVTLAP